MEGYFVVTAHWITECFQHRTVVLEFCYFPSPHTGDATADILLRVIQRYNLTERLATVTTDNGREMPPAVRKVREVLNRVRSNPLNQEWHIRCVCHILDLAVKASIVEMSGILSNLRSLLKGFRASQAMRSKFKILQQQQGSIAKDVPCLDVATRWSSTYKMCMQSFALRAVFDTVLDNHDARNSLRTFRLSPADWISIKWIMEIYEKAALFTTTSSGHSYGTICDQPRIFMVLKEHCDAISSRTNAPQFVKTMALKFMCKLTQYEQSLCSPFTQLANDLDPRSPKDGENQASIKFRLRQALREMLGVDAEQLTLPADRRGPLYADEADDNVTHEDEVDSFCRMIGNGDRNCDDVSAWWGDIGLGRFEQLGILAKRVLMAPASSVPSESTFSKSGKLVRTGRCRLTRGKVEQIMKMQSWYALTGENVGRFAGIVDDSSDDDGN